MIETAEESRKRVERAVIVGVLDATSLEDNSAEAVHAHLDELSELLHNLDVTTVERVVVKLKEQPNPRFFVGTGKADEIVQLYQELEADVLVFDTELTPTQQRNWERLLKNGCVIDRQEVILDIFADRASTREAVLQVELARLHYSLPRLTRAWTHLSRQRGGGINRGEGEAQIEIDRRLVKTKIAFLEEELATVRKQRTTQRRRRERNEIPHGAIVGYTNAGKSSLLKVLSACDEVHAEDKLFATLDPMTRKVNLPGNQTILLTDTVGFVRKLPHDLVEAFKSTLEEAVLADFLVLVLDLSSKEIDEHWDTTLSILKELGADTGDIIVVFNKVDCECDPVARQRARGLFADGLFVSAQTGEGLELLREKLRALAARKRNILQVVLPPSRYDLVAFAHERGQILENRYDENGNIQLTILINPAYRDKFKGFETQE